MSIRTRSVALTKLKRGRRGLNAFPIAQLSKLNNKDLPKQTPPGPPLNGVAGRVPWDGCPGTSGSAQVETPARVVRVVVWRAVRALQCLSRALCSSFVPLYSSSGSLLSMASTTVGCAGTPRHGRGHPAMHSMNKHEALHPMNKSLDEVLQTRPCLEALRHAGLCRLLAGAQRNILAHSQAKRTKQFLAAPAPPFTPDFPFSSRSLTFSTERAHFHYHCTPDLPLWRGAGGGGLLAGTRRRPAAEDGVPPSLQIPPHTHILLARSPAPYSPFLRRAHSTTAFSGPMARPPPSPPRPPPSHMHAGWMVSATKTPTSSAPSQGRPF